MTDRDRPSGAVRGLARVPTADRWYCRLLLIGYRRGVGVLRRLRLDNEPREPLAGQEFPRPPEQRPDSAARQNQELYMDEGPHDLGEQPGGADTERLHDGEVEADRGQVPLVEVLERGRSRLSGDAACDQATDVAALLHRDLGDARERLPALLQASRVSH